MKICTYLLVVFGLLLSPSTEAAGLRNSLFQVPSDVWHRSKNRNLENCEINSSRCLLGWTYWPESNGYHLALRFRDGGRETLKKFQIDPEGLSLVGDVELDGWKYDVYLERDTTEIKDDLWYSFEPDITERYELRLGWIYVAIVDQIWGFKFRTFLNASTAKPCRESSRFERREDAITCERVLGCDDHEVVYDASFSSFKVSKSTEVGPFSCSN